MKLQLHRTTTTGRKPTLLRDGEVALNLADTPPSVYVGLAGNVLKLGVYVSSTEPQYPTEGVIWANSSNETVLIYLNGDWKPLGGGGSGDVVSVFGRTGIVVAQASDYDAVQVDFDDTTTPVVGTNVQAAIEYIVNTLLSGIQGGLVFKGTLGFNDPDPTPPTADVAAYYVFESEGLRNIGDISGTYVFIGDWLLWDTETDLWTYVPFSQRTIPAAQVIYDASSAVIITSDNVQGALNQLDAAGGAHYNTASGHPLVNDTFAGFMSPEDKIRLDSFDGVYVSQVNAGDGLNGTGTGVVTLNVGAGTGIDVDTEFVSVDRLVVDTWYAPTTHVGSRGNTEHAEVTQTIAGFMSAADKVKLDNIVEGAGVVDEVIAGAGLGGGGSSAIVTLNVGAGTGISVAADSVAVNRTVTDTWYTPSTHVGTGGGQHALATQATAGFLSPEDKTRIDNFNPNGITDITAGNGLQTLRVDTTVDVFVGEGTGITVTTDSIEVNRSTVDSWYTPASHEGTGGAAHAAVTTTTNGFMTSADKTKLDGITSYVVSFNGRSNAVLPATSDYDAIQIDFDPSSTPLTQTNVQAAIDELVNGIIAALQGNLKYQGTIGFNDPDPTPPAPNTFADVYLFNTEGLRTVGDAAGTYVYIGDWLVWDDTDQLWQVIPFSQKTVIATAVVYDPTGRVYITSTDVQGALNELDTALNGHVGATGNAHGLVTQAVAGFMSAADKVKLDGLTGDAGVEEVIAGNGLTGGGSTSSVTLAVGAGTGITVAADTVSVNRTTVDTWYAPASHVGQGGANGTGAVHAIAAAGVDGFMSAVDKAKLDGIANGAGIVASVNAGNGLTGGGAVANPTLNVGAGTGIEVDADTVFINRTVVDAWYTPAVHVGQGGVAHAAATPSVNGFMSAADKTKLDGLTQGGIVNTVTAGNGLTGGGSSATVALNVGAGTGITVAADAVSVNRTVTDTWYTPAGTLGLPTGGAVGNLLIKDSATDGDCSWTNDVDGGSF